MPLINLQTNLKSLKFGKDRPGGGSSNQPYIKKDIPGGADPSNLFNTSGIDTLNRGGLIGPLRAANDTSRLTQMFFDLKSPNGLLFTVKENVLSRTAVKTEASIGPGYGGDAVNAGIYLPTSTIAQAASGFIGDHLNLLGLDPTGLSSLGLNNYFTIVKNQNPEDNRLLKLTTNPDPVNVLSYSGGPGSILGIGVTNIPYADQRTGVNNPQSVSYPTTFYTGSRWNTKTSGSWIPPLYRDKGVTGTYRNYIGDESVALFSNADGDPIITADGGYTYNQNWYFKTTNSGSLEATDGVANGTYQTLRWNNRTSGSWIPPLYKDKGVTGTYRNYIGDDSVTLFSNQNGDPIVTVDGGYTFNQNWDYSTTKSGSLEARKDVTDNFYQNGKYKQSPVDYTAVLKQGASRDYVTLTKAKINNDFTAANSFNVYTQGNTFPETGPLQSQNNSLTYNQVQLINTTPVSNGGTEQDFRNLLTKNLTSSTVTSKGYSAATYSNIKLENRVNIGNPGTRKDVFSYSTSTTALDKINASAMYTAATPDHTGDKNDLIKFSIGILNNDGTGESQYMHFRAFLDSFNDQYTADWGNTQYVGRADKLYNYKGFERKIGLSWTVYAQSKAELAPMYNKLNYLASSLAPTYSSAGFMQGNLARLTVGSYLYNQLGIITGITYDVPQESSWEIAIDEEGKSDTSTREMPFMIKVTGFQFTPIQDFVPQRGKQFIVQHQKEGSWNFES